METNSSQTSQKIDFLALVMKVGVPIALGLLGKYSHELNTGRKRSFWAWLAITGLSITSGCLASMICDLEGWDKPKTIVICLATLFGERLVEFVYAKFGYIIADYLNTSLDKIKSYFTTPGSNKGGVKKK